MKRPTLKSEFWINQLKLLIITFILILMIIQIDNAIVAPPWSNPNINPCAKLPGGWQFIFWKPLEQCFKIFTLGYPCPSTKELVPVENTLKLMKTIGITAECRCPPGTAEYLNTCYPLFENGICTSGHYFAPKEDVQKKNTKSGECKKIKICPNGMSYWPQEDKCLHLYKRGPCPIGKLLSNNSGLATCKCEDKNELSYYYHKKDKSCYEHFTRGPCEIIGHLYLPGDKCGCKPHFPHYQYESEQCYELGLRGPCTSGNIYTISKYDKSKFKHGKCECKENYVRWSDNICYRLYTRGPCEYKEFILNSTTCLRNNCLKGQLYYPNTNRCYHIGSQGPCESHEVFIFDFRVRPSIDGLSYNGICGCPGIIKNLDQKCTNKTDENINQDNYNCYLHGMGKMDNNCYPLYSRGPCLENEWIEPNQNTELDATCNCQPRMDNESECLQKRLKL